MEEKNWDRLNLKLLYQRLKPTKTRHKTYYTFAYTKTYIRKKGEKKREIISIYCIKITKLFYDRSVQIEGKPFNAFENSFFSGA